MDAEDLYIQDLFTGKDQYIVPVFQRRYSWKEKHWEQLWDDITLLLDSPLGEEEHFIGAFVTMSGENRPGSRPKYLVIDGQQRLITFCLILCAIRDNADEITGEMLSELSEKESDSLEDLPNKIQDENLVDPYEDGQDKYRVISRTEDRDALFTLFDRKELNAELQETSIGQAYSFFSDNIQELIEDRSIFDLHKLRQIIIEQLPLAMITAEEDENPYTIFETLNERGLDLQESDLIRNFVFMQLDLDKQDEFNQDYWLPFEQKFEETENHDKESLTRFYRIYLMRNGNYVKQNGVYDAFKERTDLEPHALAERLDYYSDLYLSIRRPETEDVDWLQDALDRKQYLDIGTADPLVLNLLDKWESGEITDDDFRRAFRGLESFAIRRSICDRSTRGYYQIFPSSINSISDENVIDSVFEYLAGRGWPDDEEFRSSFVTFDLYSREPDKCRLIFETFQRDYDHKEPVKLDDLQIEHVMPQTIGDGKHGEAWKSMLGEEWEEIHDEWKHTPGNLTLTGYNPELSNRKFDKKQELFEDSHIDLNDHFTEVNRWTEIEIRDRGEELAQRCAQLWPRPDVISTEDVPTDLVQVTILDDGVPVQEFESKVQNTVMQNTVEYLIDEYDLLDRISIPYIPGTGEGDRALLNWEPEHIDGSGMGGETEITEGLHLFTKLNSEERKRYMRELARKCNVVCRFHGQW